MDINAIKFAIFVMPILEIILGIALFQNSIMDIIKMIGVTEVILIPLYYSQKYFDKHFR